MKQLEFETLDNFQQFLKYLELIYPKQTIIFFTLQSSTFSVVYCSPALKDQSKALLNAIQNTHAVHQFQQFKITVQSQCYGTLFLINSCANLLLNDQPTQQQLMNHLNSVSPEIEKMVHIIQKVAKTNFPVLIRGESGSGKEWVAQLIHQCSNRIDQPFIAINCAALNTSILESELFGHVKGAFTGAIKDHKGLFERATTGTLFLDEIAELSLDLQAKLLRVLETGEFTPLGGEKVIKTHARIITATHRALREEAKHGRFRYDLLYRLRVIPIFVPPLRQRKTDLPLLIKQIMNEYCPSHQEPIITDQAMSILYQHHWAGNIRELKNTLLYALTMMDDGSTLDVHDLPQELVYEHAKDQTVDCSQEVTSKISKQTLHAVLESSHYDLNTVLEKLKISRSTLWRYRKKWDL